jgi:MFS family permease
MAWRLADRAGIACDRKHRRADPMTTAFARVREPSPARIALVGALCMSAAMGIGRFAFTPLLPLMQQAQGLAITDASWLAMSNYLGYLLGAVYGFVRPPRAGAAARTGIVLVVLSTFAMAGDGLAWWLALRLVSGFASALVMIGVAGWALVQLGALGRAALGGWVFGSIGVSIALAGAIVFVIGTTIGDPRVAWFVLGVVAASIGVVVWRPLAFEPPKAAGASVARDR